MNAALIAALVVAFFLNPLTVFILALLSIWAAKHGILTLRKPPRPPAPKDQP